MPKSSAMTRVIRKMKTIAPRCVSGEDGERGLGRGRRAEGVLLLELEGRDGAADVGVGPVGRVAVEVTVTVGRAAVEVSVTIAAWRATRA